MPDKNASSLRAKTLTAKKTAVLNRKSKNRTPVAVAALVMLLLGVAGTLFVFQATSSDPAPAPVAESASRADNPSTVSHPVHLFDDGNAHHFEHRTGDIAVRYFVLKSADGVIRAAFDACDVCWPAGKGYDQEGDTMVCRNCGRRFASVRINEVKGGCNPAPLKRAVEGDRLVIRIDDILAGKSYFDFS